MVMAGDRLEPPPWRFRPRRRGNGPELRVEGVQAFEREGRPGTVSDEALDARAVLALDAHGGVA